MRRRPDKAWWTEDEDIPEVPRQTMAVHEDEPADNWSGLFDASGRKLYRPRQPFGFRRG